MLENQGSRLIILATLALGLISPYFLHGIFKKRVEDNAIQEFQLQSKINLNALVAEIGSQKSTIDILQGFFKSSERVEAKEFEIFVSALPNIKKLLAVCWHSSDLSEIYSFGRRELSKTFSFAEQDKIIAEESLLMESEYVESWKGQQGFVSIFLNLRTLLESVPQDERFRHKLLIFNNSSQQFVEISLQDEKGSQFLQGEYDLREAKPISKIGDTEVFYLMSLDPNFKARLSVAEVTVCLLTFIAVMVGGGYLSQLLNVSHRIKKQVREQTKSLQAATEESHRQRLRAEDLAKHKQNFLANMSHEIRTPMNGVLGVVQLLEEEDLSEKQKHYVKVIGDSGNLMIGILNDILDQSKIDAGKIIIQKEPCQIRNLLEDLCGMYKSAAQAKDLNLELLIDSNLPEYLEVDSMRLKQIISNLISNSMKFTDKGSIDISARMAGENFEIAVEDTGIGISKDILGVIFDEFTQADSSTTRNYGGTGLGLSISHKLLKLMGSELKVKSELGEGSRFFFEIKAEECLGMGPKEEILKAEVKLEDFYWPVTSRILVAEDNATNGMIITSLLKKLGISSDIAENGQLALELFKKKSYDVILMDCQMPVMDGYDATRKIRAGDQIQPFIVALTANALPEDREKCIDVGMNEYLPKPLEIPSLLKVLVQAQEFLQKTT